MATILRRDSPTLRWRSGGVAGQTARVIKSLPSSITLAMLILIGGKISPDKKEAFSIIGGKENTDVGVSTFLLQGAVRPNSGRGWWGKNPNAECQSLRRNCAERRTCSAEGGAQTRRGARKGSNPWRGTLYASKKSCRLGSENSQTRDG